MSTFYLPSATTGYPTENENVLFRIIVTEDHNVYVGQNVRVQVYAYRTDNAETDGRGSITLYINDTEKYTASFTMGDYPINSSGVYLADEFISLDEFYKEIKVTAKISIPNTTVGTVTNGGTITFSTYTVTFDANGGSEAPNATTATVGYGVIIPNNIPKRPGYQFTRWVAQKEANNFFVDGTWSININGTNLKRIRLTRLDPDKWEALAYAENVSAIKFHTWTEKDGQNDMIQHALEPGSWERHGDTYNFGTQIHAMSHIRSHDYNDLINYVTYVYCYTSEGSLLEDAYLEHTTVYDVEFYPFDSYNYGFDVTLYAQWEPNTLDVHYNANGADISSDIYYLTDSNDIYNTSNSSKYAQRWIYDNINSGGLIDADEFGLGKIGYKFVGWNKKPDGTGDMFYENDDSLTPTWITDNIESSTNCSLTLYAIWEPFSLSYLKQNGEYVPCHTYVKHQNVWKLVEMLYKIWKPIQYVSLGDSIAAGHSIDSNWETNYGERSQYGKDGNPNPTVIVPNSYTDRLKNDLTTSYADKDVYTYSFARSGDKVTDLMTKLDHDVVRKEIQKANVVTICIGANDILSYVFPELMPYIETGSLANLEALVEQSLNVLNTDSESVSYVSLFNKFNEINPRAKYVFTTIYNPYKYLYIEEGRNGFFKPVLDVIPQMNIDVPFINVTLRIDEYIKDGILQAEIFQKLFSRVNGLCDWVEKYVEGSGTFKGLNRILKEKVSNYNNQNFSVADTKALFDTYPDRPSNAAVCYNDLVNVEFTRGYTTGTMDWGALWRGSDAGTYWRNLVNKNISFKNALPSFNPIDYIEIHWDDMAYELAMDTVNKVIVPNIDPHPETGGHAVLRQSFEGALDFDI